MIENPFTPAFGGKPAFFFGREYELSLIEEALNNEFSPYRTMFLTANRGYGKTALLEQASIMAQQKHWLTVDVHSMNAATAVIKQLTGGTARSTEKNLEPRVMGASFGNAKSTTIREYDASDLSDVLLNASRKLTLHKGIFISIDEVQKIGENDMESVCAAVQMSMRKGMPVMLLLAGLPGSKEKVSSYKGCTFMQRAWEVEIGSLLVDETMTAFHGLFGMVPSLSLEEDAVLELGRYSMGFPYLMQLLGYYLVDSYGGDNSAPPTPIDVDKATAIEPLAYRAYSENVLRPAMQPLGQSLKNYLTATAELLDENGSASTGEIAESLGKTTQQCSVTRERLLAHRLIAEDGWGRVRFNMPHLSTFLRDPGTQRTSAPDNTWDIR